MVQAIQWREGGRDDELQVSALFASSRSRVFVVPQLCGTAEKFPGRIGVGQWMIVCHY